MLMGFSYLKDLYWIDITREERFFCALAYNHFSKAPNNAIKFINDHTKLGLSKEMINQKWEIGYEVALYRDLFHSLRNSPVDGTHSYEKNDSRRKRTFDLCCFSEEAIIIVEAKAHGGFSTKQLKSFESDRINIPKLIGKKITIKIVALISSIYTPKETTIAFFDGEPITWLKLKEEYNEPLFNKADKAFRK